MTGSLATLVAFDALWAGLAACGFAVLFNTPHKMLPTIFLIGAVSHGLRAALMKLGVVGIEAGTLFAGVVIGFAALGFARARHVPVVVFALPSAIPMVPGAFAFKAMLGMLRLVGQSGAADPALATDALVSAIKTALILAAIVVGVGTPSMVFRQEDAAELTGR